MNSHGCRPLHVNIPAGLKQFVDETFSGVTRKAGIMALILTLEKSIKRDPTIVGALLSGHATIVRNNEIRGTE